MPKKASRESELLATLKETASELRTLGINISAHAKRRFRTQISNLGAELQEIAAGHDPVAMPTSVFDPTDPKVGGRIVAMELVAQPVDPMADLRAFYGSGVYAIYYTGSEPAYAPIAGKDHPIYVGKADPDDSHAKGPPDQGTRLWKRLSEHASSISKASNLEIHEFRCRSLVVATGWESAAEAHLIRLFKPIWNKEQNVCFGIGKHGDAAEMRKHKRSPWDTMHPGRAWAALSEGDQRSRNEVITQISQHFSRHPPYGRAEEVVMQLLSEMNQQLTL